MKKETPSSGKHMVISYVGERLKQLRKAEGLTMQQLGDKVGVNKSVISRMESNENIPTISLLTLNNIFKGVGYKIVLVPDENKMALLKKATQEIYGKRSKPRKRSNEVELFRTKPRKPRPTREIKPYPDAIE